MCSADDFVIGFREESDAKCCMAALRERFTQFGLELHPDKTRLIEFERSAAERRSKRGDDPPETFDFLSFTHISGTTRKGNFTIRRISSAKKLHNKLRELKDKLKRKMHLDLAQVGSWLSSVYRGWCNDHAIPGNSPRLQQFRTALPATLAPRPATTLATRPPDDLAEVLNVVQALASDTENPASLSRCAI